MDTAARPDWLAWALAQDRTSRFTDSAGTRVHYAAWNAEDIAKPALLFAHGFLGHSHWWDFIAPFFTGQHRVFALDFSGMGQSGHRASYSADCFVDDLAAVLGAIHVAGAPASTVIGHSFGGARLLQACAQIPQAIGHAIVLDSFATFPGDQPTPYAYSPAPAPTPDRETTLARFRLLPPQRCEPGLLEHVARHSLRRVDAGWTWCFDPALRQFRPDAIDPALLGRAEVPVDYVHAEDSAVVSAQRALRIAGALRRGRGPITMPRAGHHLMLDQPLALVGVLRALLAGQRPSALPD
ncbi:MAG: alpha/beta fold hydrolase [Burkholderiaceae bacterium]